MALYGGQRDISLFRHLNRELLGNIITQQCSFYKFRLDETKVNIYGEASEEKYYTGPILLNCLIDRGDQEHPVTDIGVDFNRGITFKFFRDDLLNKAQDFNINSPYGADLIAETGDIIMYQNRYYEIYNVIINQYFAGKNPVYPNNPNPYNPDLENFGSSISIICSTYYIPADKVGISLERLI